MRVRKLDALFYRVAGQLLELKYPDNLSLDKCLPSFEEFVESNFMKQESRIQMEIRIEQRPKDHTEKKLLSDTHNTWQNRFRFEEDKTHYITSIANEQSGEPTIMYSSKDFTKSIIYIKESEVYSTNIISWLIMVAFAQASILDNIILLHASVVEKQGEGIAFLGKSGTGKSTHSRLWMERFTKVSLLNDDNPALKIGADGFIYIYGTPWSGKTSCYINRGVKVRAIVRLRQAQKNKFIAIKGVEALLAVLPSCSAIRWNRTLFDKMVNHVEKIIEKIGVGEMQCMPNKEAAEICLNGIEKYKIN